MSSHVGSAVVGEVPSLVAYHGPAYREPSSGNRDADAPNPRPAGGHQQAGHPGHARRREEPDAGRTSPLLRAPTGTGLKKLIQAVLGHAQDFSQPEKGPREQSPLVTCIPARPRMELAGTIRHRKRRPCVINNTHPFNLEFRLQP